MPLAYSMRSRAIPLTDNDGGRGCSVTAAACAEAVDRVHTIFGSADLRFIFDPANDWHPRGNPLSNPHNVRLTPFGVNLRTRRRGSTPKVWCWPTRSATSSGCSIPIPSDPGPTTPRRTSTATSAVLRRDTRSPTSPSGPTGAGSDKHALWVGDDWHGFSTQWEELSADGLRLLDVEVSGDKVG